MTLAILRLYPCATSCTTLSPALTALVPSLRCPRATLVSPLTTLSKTRIVLTPRLLTYYPRGTLVPPYFPCWSQCDALREKRGEKIQCTFNRLTLVPSPFVLSPSAGRNLATIAGVLPVNDTTSVYVVVGVGAPLSETFAAAALPATVRLTLLPFNGVVGIILTHH